MSNFFLQYQEIFLAFILSIFSGFFLFFSLIIIKQKWVNTFYYFLSFLLLPPIALTITKIISNNLALSLGMIGALSIVRFRTPIKNPFELVIYFGLITLGVAFGVNQNFAILLLLAIISIIFLSKLFELTLKKLNINSLFNYSFSTNDGELKSIIEVEASNKIQFLENHQSLIYLSINGNKYIYKIASSNKTDIKQIKEKISSLNEIISIDVRYGD